MLGICGTQPLAARFLLRFHSKNRAPPAKNGSATATITIKPERLAHAPLCGASLTLSMNVFH